MLVGGLRSPIELTLMTGWRLFHGKIPRFSHMISVNTVEIQSISSVQVNLSSALKT